jgi:hypothetical protein
MLVLASLYARVARGIQLAGAVDVF